MQGGMNSFSCIPDADRGNHGIIRGCPGARSFGDALGGEETFQRLMFRRSTKIFNIKLQAKNVAPSVFTNLSHNIQTMLVTGSECPDCTNATSHSASPGEKFSNLCVSHGKSSGAFAFALIFLLLFLSRKKVKKDFSGLSR